MKNIRQFKDDFSQPFDGNLYAYNYFNYDKKYHYVDNNYIDLLNTCGFTRTNTYSNSFNFYFNSKPINYGMYTTFPNNVYHKYFI